MFNYSITKHLHRKLNFVELFSTINVEFVSVYPWRLHCNETALIEKHHMKKIIKMIIRIFPHACFSVNISRNKIHFN